METDLILDLPSDVQAIGSAVDYVLECCQGCEEDPRRLRLNFRVGLTEALSNAVLYGNGEDPSKRVRVEVAVSDRAIMARVWDEGTGFDPDDVPDPTTPPHLTRPSGRGLFLMRNLLDEVRFNDRGNCVTLVLRLSPETGIGGGARA